MSPQKRSPAGELETDKNIILMDSRRDFLRFFFSQEQHCAVARTVVASRMEPEQKPVRKKSAPTLSIAWMATCGEKKRLLNQQF